jgi:hypothetical protein
MRVEQRKRCWSSCELSTGLRCISSRPLRQGFFTTHSAYVSIRQHTSAYVSGAHTSDACLRGHFSRSHSIFTRHYCFQGLFATLTTLPITITLLDATTEHFMYIFFVNSIFLLLATCTLNLLNTEIPAVSSDGADEGQNQGTRELVPRIPLHILRPHTLVRSGRKN